MMTAPRFLPCRCKHAKLMHDGARAPQCTAPHCGCLGYRPATEPAVPQPARIETPAMSTPATNIADAKVTGNPRIVRLAERANEAFDDLHAAMLAWREQEGTRRDIAELERRLAAARAKLKPNAKVKAPSTRERKPCPICGGEYANLGVHRYKAHPS